MKMRSWKVYILVLTFLFTAFMSPIALAKQDNAGKGNGSSNQLQSISQKIERIENRIDSVSAAMDDYFSTQGDQDEEEPGSGEEGTGDTEENPAEDEGTGDTEENPAGDEGTGDAEENPAGDEDTGDAEENPAGDEGTGDAEENPAGDEGTGDVEENPAGDEGAGDGEENPAGDEGTGDAEENPAGDEGTGDVEENPAGDEGAGDVEENPAGDEGAGDVEENPAGDEGAGDVEENPVTGEEDTGDSDTSDDELVDEEDPASGDEEANDEETNEEEESISGYSFIGKLNALSNNLNSAEKRLENLAGKIDADDEEYLSLYTKIEELRDRISEELDRLDDLESPVLTKMRSRIEEQEEFAVGQNIVAPDKEWRIKFSKNLNEKTLSKMNIFVVDSNESLVAIDVSFDSAEGAVLISPVEEYLSGETYTLFISKDVKSQAGNELKNAVKVVFTVE